MFYDTAFKILMVNNTHVNELDTLDEFSMAGIILEDNWHSRSICRSRRESEGKEFLTLA